MAQVFNIPGINPVRLDLNTQNRATSQALDRIFQQQREDKQKQQQFQNQLAVAKQTQKFALDRQLAIAKFKQENKSPVELLIEQAQAAEAAKTLGREDLFNRLRGKAGEPTGRKLPVGDFSQFGTAFAGQEQVPQQPLAPQRDLTTLRGEFVGGRQQDLITPKFKVETDAFGNQTLVPKEIISLSAQKQLDKSSESIKQSLKLTDEFVKANRNVMRTAALFSGMVGQLKGKAIEQKGLGLIPGLKGRFGLFTKQPGFGRTAGFEGQEKETAIALNSILTGQNRVIKSVVEMIEATLPGDLDPEDVAASKISQSLTNAFKLNLSFKKGLLSPDKIEALSEGNEAFDLQRELSSIVTLSPKDQETLDSIIENILNTPATKKQTLFPGGQFKETERGVSGLSDEELDRQIAEAESKIKGR